LKTEKVFLVRGAGPPRKRLPDREDLLNKLILPNRKCLGDRESLLDRGTFPDYTTVLGTEKIF
jgi:hypothetical protein